MVKNLPAVQEMWVPSLGWEDPLEKEMATHSSVLAWKIPMDWGAWQATIQRVTESDTTEHARRIIKLILQYFLFYIFAPHLKIFLMASKYLAYGFEILKK